MVRHLLAAALLATAVSATAQQPPQATAPGAEQKNLAYFVGSWKMEGTVHPSPFMPGGTTTGTETCRQFEGGWHVVCESAGTGPLGPMKGLTLMTYDRATKQYRFFGVNNMPDAEMAVGGKSGNTWTWTNEMVVEGKTVRSRFVIVETSAAAYTAKWDMSLDGGKTWQPVFEAKVTKTS